MPCQLTPSPPPFPLLPPGKSWNAASPPSCPPWCRLRNPAYHLPTRAAGSSGDVVYTAITTSGHRIAGDGKHPGSSGGNQPGSGGILFVLSSAAPQSCLRRGSTPSPRRHGRRAGPVSRQPCTRHSRSTASPHPRRPACLCYKRPATNGCSPEAHQDNLSL